MRRSFRQCLAWLFLTLTLICIKFTYATDISTNSRVSSSDDPLEGPSRPSGPGPPEKPPPQLTFSADKASSKSVFKSMFNYLFGLDYPYHHFIPPKEEETIEIPESKYTRKKVDFSHVDFAEMDDEQLSKMLHDILLEYHPGHYTHYNADWGHTVLTRDGQIPLEGDAIHFDIFDGYLPRGLSFTDLRVLFLYTVDDGYYLYKIKIGDLVVTLRPDLENVTVHLFENYGGLMMVRILFFVEGMFERHEYVETGMNTRIFKKLSGRSITPPMPKFPEGQDVTEDMIRDWMVERYKEIAKKNPTLVEELVNYKIVFTR